MANSKYEYVRKFERQPTILYKCWPIIRLDGRSFTKFSNDHCFEKPNDKRGLDLMNAAAMGVMREFADIRVAYGESDEFSFVFDKETEIYGRRSYKLISLVSSCFTGHYMQHWCQFFPDTQLQYPPMFDARLIEHPTTEHVRDYLSWRQVDTHINNQYNTCFWALVKSGMSKKEANNALKGTDKDAKNELLFHKFGINYNDLPEQFKKGSMVFWQPQRSFLAVKHVDIIQEEFWTQNPILHKP